MTPGALREAAWRWRAAARPAVVVEIEHSRGSVPREAGTRMLVAADEVLGTIGGGHLELRAVADARRLLAGAPLARQQAVALGPSLGQCCGGALALRFTPLAELPLDDPGVWPAEPARFHLQLYGAGHVGRAVVRLLAELPCWVRWIDQRESEFPAGPRPPHIEAVCSEPAAAEMAAAPPGAFHLVLTHSHALDLAWASAILERGDFGWFGLIGSATKRARFEHRLRARGVADEMLARMVCPIGLPGLVGKEPEVIAVSVVAQLLLQASPAAAK